MPTKITLVGNPNSGKTTLFNLLTGSNQFVGNWPGVTVEKKEGKIKKLNDTVLVDLPGIYSLSPYTLEEVVSRNFIIDEKPDVIINIVDGTNLERNLYLTTQLIEIGTPVIIALNMLDAVRKNGDIIDTLELKKKIGCDVIQISALKNEGIDELIKAVTNYESNYNYNQNKYDDKIEEVISYITEKLLSQVPENNKRWYAVKLFERDEKIIEKLNITKESFEDIEIKINKCEEELDDDSESLITNERYNFVTGIVGSFYKKKSIKTHTTTDKIDKIVTNRILALPIFAVVMFLIYFISVSTVGAFVTDWTNDGLFGEGWHLSGGSEYEAAAQEYAEPAAIIEYFESAAEKAGLEPLEAIDLIVNVVMYDEDGIKEKEFPATYNDYLIALKKEKPNPYEYGIWVPGIPVLVENGLEAINCAPWLQNLIVNGIVGGVGAILGFVPQMLMLFLLLAILEACGYMARIAFILDRLFRKFGLSGKSFIPMLIGTGCGVPGIMASRTIENQHDRRMTIITTTFIPCGAKLPIIALIAGALFDKAWWVAPVSYFIGIMAIIISGIMLKKTKLFSGEPAPFIMELPAYRLPRVSNVLRSTWERGWSFIKKAGTVILLSTIFIWFTSNYGWENGSFGSVEMSNSILAKIGNFIAPIFTPLGWGRWETAVATITGFIAKENVVATMGVLYTGMEEVAGNGWQVWDYMRDTFTAVSAFSFLVFNLLCAPCFAAMGAIKREMNNWKWTTFAIAYQCVLAYAVSLIIYQFGTLFTGGAFGIGTIAAIILLAFIIFMIFRPSKNKKELI
ncbi:ferrous iron transport protein B [Eubacteriales bacterium OttesenSCG-928-G02]|nr:ferrous iron transport protein B [Eubacteriales bacterium OttesenSCG-928-G02]